jgi:hypothetical protein
VCCGHSTHHVNVHRNLHRCIHDFAWANVPARIIRKLTGPPRPETAMLRASIAPDPAPDGGVDRRKFTDTKTDTPVLGGNSDDMQVIGMAGTTGLEPATSGVTGMTRTCVGSAACSASTGVAYHCWKSVPMRCGRTRHRQYRVTGRTRLNFDGDCENAPQLDAKESRRVRKLAEQQLALRFPVRPLIRIGSFRSGSTFGLLAT